MFRQLLTTLTTTLALTLAAVATSVTATADPSTAGATSQGPVPMFTNTDRAAVNEAFLNTYLPLSKAPTPWNGAVAECNPGTVNTATLNRTGQMISYIRSLNGLDPVAMDPAASLNAQRAALMMAANNTLSHFPPTSWKCYTAAGAAAAGQSNLNYATGPGSVVSYMDDDGDSNTFVGHRRWILNPTTTVMASGDAGNKNALTVFGIDNDRNDAATSPDWVPWPAAGYFPSTLEPDGRWSVSSDRADTDFTNANVTMRRGTTAIKVAEHPVEDGYGPNTLVWQLPSAVTVGTYTVTISGVTRNEEPVPAFSYEVIVFAPGRPATFTSPPTIRGVPRVGVTLQAVAGTTSPSGLGHSFGWFRDGRTRVGSSRTYTPTSTDVGHTLQIRDDASGEYVTRAASSATTRRVALGAAPRLLTRPRLVGKARPNRILTLKGMRWDTAGLRFSYQWTRNGVPIAGATRAVWKLTRADARRTVAVRIRATKPGHAAATVTSFARVVRRR